MIKLDVATNMDVRILDHIRETDTNHSVDSMFGKLKKDVIGGGRSSVSVPDVTLEEVFAYNATCRDMGIRFNYLLNPLCLGNRDVLPEEHRKIVAFLDQLYEGGIRWVTVCSPYLLKIIKNRYADMNITIGLYAFITNLQQAVQWVQMGANEITMSQSYNRNFPALEILLKTLKDEEVNIRLIANNGCLHECPFAVSHGSAASHSSAEQDESSSQYFDYNIINCYNRKINTPDNILASDWIRPEDLHYYEELCDKTGNHRLLMKLVERTKSTDFLIRVIDAYRTQHYDGNLIDLFNWIGNNGIDTGNDNSQYLALLQSGSVDMKSFVRYSSFFDIPQVYLDNQALEGFIKHFVYGYHCDQSICWMKNQDPDKDESLYCSYCHEWRKKTLTINQSEYQKWSKGLAKLKDDFESSRFFHAEVCGE
ncbi:MAG: U32 family peptidase [Ruminococcus sp.]|nr:U32 family peptidase [Ruminococcus sp.]